SAVHLLKASCIYCEKLNHEHFAQKNWPKVVDQPKVCRRCSSSVGLLCALKQCGNCLLHWLLGLRLTVSTVSCTREASLMTINLDDAHYIKHQLQTGTKDGWKTEVWLDASASRRLP